MALPDLDHQPECDLETVRTFREGLFASLSIHLLIVLAVILWFWKHPTPKTEEWLNTTKPVDMISEQALRDHMRSFAAPKPSPLNPRVVETSSDLSTPTQEQLKQKARFLSEKTQRVAKESISKEFGSVQGNDHPSKTGDQSRASEESPEVRIERLKRLGLSPQVFSPAVELSKPPPVLEAQRGAGRLRKGTMDQIDDVAVGSETLLNTDEYIYASFFNRLKREVGPRWEPMISRIVDERASDHSYDANGQKRRPLAGGDYTTQILFRMDSNGEIQAVDVKTPSGYAPFDEAAKNAVWQLLRMKNLPKALRDSDGYYRIQLGFVVNLQNQGVRMDYVPDPRLN